MPLKIAVTIATTGRPAVVADAVRDLRRQSRKPNRVVVSASQLSDVEGLGDGLRVGSLAIEVVTGPKGLCMQRNAALGRLAEEDVVLFLDDDFVMASDFLEELEATFEANPDVAMATGQVLADGIGGAGLTAAEARQRLDGHLRQDFRLVDVNNAYGCNMAARLEILRRHGIRFDDALPLYGWLEDVDFSRRVAAHGRCVRAMALRGVHLGVKSGRTSGLRLGYSQVANPLHLVERRTMGRRHALRMISRNLLANVARSLSPEPWVDRRGRLRGNALAISDLVRGRLDPRRVLLLEARPDARS